MQTTRRELLNRLAVGGGMAAVHGMFSRSDAIELIVAGA
jgi:hypothetical protein